jgi:thiol-disulfide isomerase/thioredoxin
MLCLIFIPFYSFYWWYVNGERNKRELTKSKKEATGNGIVYLVLNILRLDIVSMAIMQSDINSADVEIKPLSAKSKRLIVKITSGVLATALLVGALLYYNVFDNKEPPADETPSGPVEPSDPSDPTTPAVGYNVGNLCPTADLKIVGSDEYVNAESLRGKIVVINFWGTWCTPCVQELPHFDEAATNFKDSVKVIAIHSSSSFGNTPADEYVETYYPESEMIFALDTPSASNAYVDAYYSALGGVSTYPMTLVLDEDGVIVYRREGSLTYAELVEAIEAAK